MKEDTPDPKEGLMALAGKQLNTFMDKTLAVQCKECKCDLDVDVGSIIELSILTGFVFGVLEPMCESAELKDLHYGEKCSLCESYLVEAFNLPPQQAEDLTNEVSSCFLCAFDSEFVEFRRPISSLLWQALHCGECAYKNGHEDHLFDLLNRFREHQPQYERLLKQTEELLNQWDNLDFLNDSAQDLGDPTEDATHTFH